MNNPCDNCKYRIICLYEDSMRELYEKLENAYANHRDNAPAQVTLECTARQYLNDGKIPRFGEAPRDDIIKTIDTKGKEVVFNSYSVCSTYQKLQRGEAIIGDSPCIDCGNWNCPYNKSLF